MNVYGDIAKVMQSLNEPKSAELLEYLEFGSRAVDTWCNRHFFAWAGERVFAGTGGDLRIDDLLSVERIEVEWPDDNERTIDLEQIKLVPYNQWPKWEMRVKSGERSPEVDSEVRISGVWGYGTGRTAHPWKATAIELSLNVDDEAVQLLQAPEWTGKTLLLGDEQIYVQMVDSDGTMHLERGVNNTEAEEHIDALVYTALYPMEIRRVSEMLCVDLWNNRDKEGFTSETIRSYTYQRGGVETILNNRLQRILGPFVRYDRT